MWALRKRILLSFKAVQTMAVVMKQCLVRQSAVSTSLEFGLNHQWLNSQGQGVKAIERTDVCILYKTSLPFSKVLNWLSFLFVLVLESAFCRALVSKTYESRNLTLICSLRLCMCQTSSKWEDVHFNQKKIPIQPYMRLQQMEITLAAIINHEEWPTSPLLLWKKTISQV